MAKKGITLSKISLSFGSRTLFDDVNITFNPGQRIAITGPNGAGKSTLLKIIIGEIDPNTGDVSLPQKVGVLEQNIDKFSDDKVIDVVIMGNKFLWRAMQEREALYNEEMTDEVGMRLGELEGIVAEEDGYSAEANAEILLHGMGIEPDMYQRKMGEIPTDLQFRVLLCQALFGDPDALLLDEPTNHLDLDSIGWLETFLHNYQGSLIVISHDRHFLNAVVTHCADIDYETIILYPGNYDEMVVAKSSVRDQADREAKSKEKKIAQLRDFVARFGAGTRASQVQSRLREIDRLQPQELKKSNIQRPYIRFIPSEVKSGKLVFKLNNVSKGYGEGDVIKKFSMEIERGDRVGVIGANGRGKTTLLKLLAGVHQPDSGTIEIGHQVQMSYFPQNHEDMIDKQHCTQNAFDWLQQQKPGAYEQEIRGVMGKMLFGGDDAFKKVATLSGGETARVILAKMLLLEHNTIILDEPNNHLDLESVSALAWGLEQYTGTVIVACHDRDLIQRVATKIIAFEPDGIHVYQGTLDGYLGTGQHAAH